MKIFVVIPTYNEKKNIGKLISTIIKYVPFIYIVIVDDNSPDKTADEVKRLQKLYPRKIFLLIRKFQKGRGSAGVEGFKFALKKGAEAVVEMDADFSHHPKYLKVMVQELKSCDIVVGSRFLLGGMDTRNFIRTLITKLSRFYIRCILGIDLTDPTSGFRVFKKEVLCHINLDSLKTINSWVVVQEMLYKPWLLGFHIKEIPIVFVDRKRGYSKLSLKVLFQSLFLLCALRFKYSKYKGIFTIL